MGSGVMGYGVRVEETLIEVALTIGRSFTFASCSSGTMWALMMSSTFTASFVCETPVAAVWALIAIERRRRRAASLVGRVWVGS